MAKSGVKAKSVGDEKTPRTWKQAVTWSVIALAALLTLSIVVNLAIGRVIHWDIVTGIAVVGFIFLTVGRRYRTI